LLLAACGAGAIAGWRALKMNRDWPVAAGGLAAVAAFIAHGFTDAGWSIISIALLLMIALALLDSLRGDQLPTISEQPRINYFWLFFALLFAVLTAGHQRVVQAEDLLEKSRRLLSQGAPEQAAQAAREATEFYPQSARLWHNRGRVEEAIGQPAEDSYLQAAQLQPTKAPHLLALARSSKEREKAEDHYNAAIRLDQNDTGLRLSRAEYYEQTPAGKEKAWADYEYVARLYEAPYGKYPAIAEMVNLDFARAFIKLGERSLRQKDAAQAKLYAQRTAEILKIWRANEQRNRKIAEDAGSDEQFARETREVEQLEEQLSNLRERAK
jgi:tetratricopeptide (TPR) repeat protein